MWPSETGLAKLSFLIDVSSGLPVLALPARVVLVHGRRLCAVFLVKERGDVCEALVGGCESVLGLGHALGASGGVNFHAPNDGF